MKYRVLVADPSMIARQAFERMVDSSEQFQWMASVGSPAAAVEYMTQNHAPDIILMDIINKNGRVDSLTALEKLHRDYPRLKILLVTSLPEVSLIRRARQAGADSFWYKEAQDETLMSVMQRTMKGESVYPEKPPVVSIGNAVSIELTERETDVLRELTDGASNQEIARRLGITVRTVKMHITCMMQKTGFRSRLELALRAQASGIVIPYASGGENE